MFGGGKNVKFGWMDGWMHGMMDGLMDAWNDGWMDGCMDDGWMDACMNGYLCKGESPSPYWKYQDQPHSPEDSLHMQGDPWPQRTLKQSSLLKCAG